MKEKKNNNYKTGVMEKGDNGSKRNGRRAKKICEEINGKHDR